MKKVWFYILFIGFSLGLNAQNSCINISNENNLIRNGDDGVLMDSVPVNVHSYTDNPFRGFHFGHSSIYYDYTTFGNHYVEPHISTCDNMGYFYPPPYSGNGFYQADVAYSIIKNYRLVLRPDSSRAYVVEDSLHHTGLYDSQHLWVNFFAYAYQLNCAIFNNPSACQYELEFYARPQEMIHRIGKGTNVTNDTINSMFHSQNIFCQRDYSLIDSFCIVTHSISNSGGNSAVQVIDSVFFGTPTTLRDTTQWHKYSVTFDRAPNSTFFIALLFAKRSPQNGLNSLFASGYNYDSLFLALEDELLTNNHYYNWNMPTSYLFDSISLKAISVPDFQYCYLPDTSLCLSDSVLIDAYHPEFSSYLWNTGDTTASIVIDSAGTYTLQAFYPCGVICDEFIVYPSAPDSLLPYQDTISICPLQLPYTLQADSLANYLWSTGDTTKQMIAQSSGLYIIESTFYCGVVRDSVYIKIKAKEAENLIAFTDTLVCAKALPFALAIADTFQSYAWNNGATTAQNTFAQADEYSVEISDGCHLHQDTFRLQTEDLDTGVFVQQHFYCPQDFPINIDGFVFNEAKDTISSQTQSNSCGSRTDSILLFVLPSALQEKPSINIIDSCKQLGYCLVNVLAKDTNFSYQWESGNPLQFTTKGGETQQLVISNACSTFKIDTFIAKCPEQIIFALPTAFSPNNDGVNDAFRLLYLNPDYELIDLSIFNRWGSQIFSTDQVKTAWEGKFQNKNCPIDEYVYQLKLRHKTTSAVEVFSGSVLLLF